MGVFAGTIDLERSSKDGPDEFIVSSALIYRANDDTLFSIQPGWTTDGGSVPAIFWPILGPPIRSLALPAYLLHDILYKSHATSRAKADALLREGAIACGYSKWKAWSLWIGVRMGGLEAWNRFGEVAAAKHAEFVQIGVSEVNDGGT